MHPETAGTAWKVQGLLHTARPPGIQPWPAVRLSLQAPALYNALAALIRLGRSCQP